MATIALYLPKGITLCVKEGNEVHYGQTLAQSPSENVIYTVGKLFSIKPQDIQTIIVKKEGEEFAKGDVLVRKRTLWATKTLRSSFAGKVARIDGGKGELEVSPGLASQDTRIVSPVDGLVQKIDNEQMLIDFHGMVIFAKQGIGKMKKGLLTIVAKKDGESTLSDIRKDHEQKILLGGYFPRAVLEKAFGIGAEAVLATRLEEGDFAYLEERKVFNACLALVSGTDYDTLEKYEGKEVVIEGMHKRIISQA